MKHRIETNEQPVSNPSGEQAGCSHNRRSLVIGLTGGVADGKTTVGHMLKSFGAVYISADAIVHELLQRGTDVWRSIVSRFGDGVLRPDGEIDRRRLGAIVFTDSEMMAELEGIIHPRVFARLTEIARDFKCNRKGILVLEIPLLVEKSYYAEIDKVLVVASEQETQICRLQERYGIDRKAAVERIASQLPTSEKVKHADWVISTNTTLEETREQAERVYASAQKLLAQGK